MPDRKPTTLRGSVDAEDWNGLASWLESCAVEAASVSELEFTALLQTAAAYRLVAAQQETADLHQIVRLLNERIAKLERG